MKRVTLLLDDASRRADGYAFIVDTADGAMFFGLRSERVISVEDVPDPLPTTPGERFWGRSAHFGPQWWFVAGSNSCRPDPDEVDYVGADGTHISSLLAVESHGLTRLQDPEPQP